MFVCNNCKKEFKNSRCYKNHIINNKCKIQYYCPKCNKKFTNEKYYISHINKCNYIKKNKVIYTCSLCKLNFNSKGELTKHQSNHIKNGDCKCIKCNKLFKKFYAYDNHVNTCNYDINNPYKCSFCNKGFKTHYELGGHVNACHSNNYGLKYFTCPICNKKMYCNNGSYKFHINMHNESYKQDHIEKTKAAINEFYNDAEKSKKVREQSSQRMKINNPSHNPETLQKITESRKKYINNLSDVEYSKMVNNYINAPKKGNSVNHSGKYTATSIEKMIIDLNIIDLQYNGNKKGCKTIRFENKLYRRSFTPDFIYKNKNVYVETFGVYWHPKEDEKKYWEEMSKNNYKFIILWEDKLNKNFEKEKRRLLKFLYKIDNQ